MTARSIGYERDAAYARLNVDEKIADGRRPMRFAYADPPYPGQSWRLYGDHEDYAGEVDHAELIDRLEGEYPDGWALSTSASALPEVLELCPRGLKGREHNPKNPGRVADGTGVRVLSWNKVNGPHYPTRVQYTWEPVILRRGRRTERYGKALDALVLPVYRKPSEGFVGAKPASFCRWLFTCLGARPGDELDDLFPGSGAVTAAWAEYVAAPSQTAPAARPAKLF